ncbi:MAG: PEP-CTERM sorting domain-containing protein, partial [Methylomonas sp.]
NGLTYTWSADANLLGTLESSYGYNTIVNAILADDPVIHDTPNLYDIPPNSGTYAISTSDFGSGGQVDWWGSEAFIHFLNDQHYGGANEGSNPWLWMLPATNPATQGFGAVSSTSLMGELFYNELGGHITGPTTTDFTNIQSGKYWSSTEATFNYGYAWTYNTSNGDQDYFNDYKYLNNYALPIAGLACTLVGNVEQCSPNNPILPNSLVPEPEMFWLLLTGLGLLSIKRRGGIA